MATVELIEDGTLIKIDQQDLQTVLPAIQSRVLIVNGRARGQFATLTGLVEKQFKAEITVTSGPLKGTSMLKLYEDICKYAD